MNKISLTIIALVAGGVLGMGISPYINLTAKDEKQTAVEKQPLYWVAPMDANYRRDKPGKSPMGMELIPVYEEPKVGGKQKPGTIRIDSAVENNLGVKVAEVKLQPLTSKIETVGYVNFDQDLLWQSDVRVAGWVDKSYVHSVGEKVKKGDVIFTFYSPELVKAQEELISAHKSGRLNMLRSARTRLKTLGVDEVQINEIEKQGVAKQYIEVKSKVDGIIATLDIHDGSYLTPARSAVTVGALDHMWIEIEVLEHQSHWLTYELSAQVTSQSVPDKVWNGIVDYVYPIVDKKSRTVKVRLLLDNKDYLLKPNMFTNVTLKVNLNEEALTIPVESVIRAGNMTRVVLAEGEGKYRSARIRVGRQSQRQIEVLEGLKSGDKVVTSAQFLLDSESSQSAELSRINSTDSVHDLTSQPANTVWGKGIINGIDNSSSILSINHQPIPEWEWPSMIMDFKLSPNARKNAEINLGDSVEFELEKDSEGGYQIIKIKQDINTTMENWIDAEVDMVMAEFGMISFQHEALPIWQWNAGEVNFDNVETHLINDLKTGDHVRILVKKQMDSYRLIKVERVESMRGEQ